MEEYTPLFAAIGSLALVGTASATWLSVTTSRRMLAEDRRYKARLYALQLAERWETVTHHARSQLRKAHAHQLAARQPIPLEALQDDTPQATAASDHAETILALLDHVGLALQSGVADESILRGFFAPIVDEWGPALSALVAHERRGRELDPWPALEVLGFSAPQEVPPPTSQ